jgi:23S rRNA pseudouridine1911/1915/1917 synthase
MEFQIDESSAGKRLDVFVAAKLAIGRNEVKRMLARGGVRLNGRKTTEKDKGLLLYKGSVVAVDEVSGESDRVVPQEEMGLTVLKEGEGWVAVDKPAGLAVHPLETGEKDTLLNAVVARYPEIQGVGEGGLRSGVVHRLDVDTSGVVLFATAHVMWTVLRRAFEEHQTKKVYRAIVKGELEGSRHEEMALIVAQHRPARVKVVENDHPQGRMCNLTWKAVEELTGATLVEIELGTGFLHQIRVMMAALGHPILGDLVYGEGTGDAPRQMLHASYLSAGPAKAQSPDPEDFAGVLETLRG